MVVLNAYSAYLLNLYFFTEIAVSPNNNVVNIYEKKGKDWIKIHELTEHSGHITGNVTYCQLWLQEICKWLVWQHTFCGLHTA